MDFNLPECKIPEPSESKSIALERVLKHKDGIISVNPLENDKIEAHGVGTCPLLMDYNMYQMIRTCKKEAYGVGKCHPANFL